jgi:HAE1 family hydrophobic/amphiphilic exporter-1
MFTLILVLFGSISYFRLGLELMPEIDYPALTIFTVYRGAATEDVEQLVTWPIEEAIAGVSGIDKLNSTSSEGLSVVTVVFDWGTDLDMAGIDIRDNIGLIRNDLPPDIEEPIVKKFDVSQMPILVYGVTGMDDLLQMQKYLEDVIAPRIERAKGVASVTVTGGPEREINVYLNKTRLDQYKIGPEMVANALATANRNLPNGYLEINHTEFLVRTMGEFDDLETIGNTVIAVVGDALIRVNDVGRVVDTYKERRSHVRLNGADGIMIEVTKESGANTLEAVKQVRKIIGELKTGIASNLEFVVVSDQGEQVEFSTGNTGRTAVSGGVIAILVLWVFLRNWRPTIVIALAIPISIITTFIGLYAFGYTLNVMTLAGFALAAGMLIDNAVVVIENIVRHMDEEKSDRIKASVDGTNEVGLAILASTLTTVAVFVPLAMVDGIAGIISRPLAITVCAGLAASLLVAITVIPMFASMIFNSRGEDGAKTAHKAKKRANKKSGGSENDGGRILLAIRAKYEKMLGWALNYRFVVVLGTGALFAASLWGVTKLGGEFMPDADRGESSILVTMPVGTGLDGTKNFVSFIEDRAMEIPEVLSVCARIGGEGIMGGDVNEAEIFFRLVPFAERSRSLNQVKEELRRSFPNVHDVVITFKSAGMMAGSDIEVKFFGDDVARLKGYADSAAAIMGGMPGLRDLDVSMKAGKPEFRIIPDRDKAARMGFTVTDIGAGIMYANMGVVATQYREGGDEYDVRVRMEERDRATVDEFMSMPLVSRAGVSTSVMNIGQVKAVRGPTQIFRENRTRYVQITTDVAAESDIQTEALKIQTALKDLEASLPDGYFMQYGGAFEDMQTTFRDMFLALLVAIVLIFMILAAQFESLTQPFIIMFTVPLAFIGVVIGLTIMGHSLSLPSFMGVIVLVGIVLNNGIVLIDYINQQRAKGTNMRDALIQAGGTRLRPILITSFTTILGLLPMVFATGQGSETMSPLGTAVCFGLASSTFFTLFVVPVFYSIIVGFSESVARFFSKAPAGGAGAAK